MKHVLALAAAFALSSLAAAQPAPAELDAKAVEDIEAAFADLADIESRKRALAEVSGTLLLRDASYRYGERLAEGGLMANFSSAGCDILQVVLTVLEGPVTLTLTETSASDRQSILDGTFIYPDKLYPESGMFSYTLYSNHPLKAVGIRNGDFVGDTRSARVTAFSYCFSTDPFAAEAFFDREGVMH